MSLFMDSKWLEKMFTSKVRFRWFSLTVALMVTYQSAYEQDRLGEKLFFMMHQRCSFLVYKYRNRDICREIHSLYQEARCSESHSLQLLNTEFTADHYVDYIDHGKKNIISATKCKRKG